MLLDQLLDNLAVQVEPFATCEVGTGSDLELDSLDWVTFHFVLTGTGTLSVPGREPLGMRPHSLAIVPRGMTHTLAAHRHTTGTPDMRPVGIEGTRRYRAGDGPGELILACGHFQARYARGVGLFELLDRPILLDFSNSEEMHTTFEHMLEESRSASPGSLAMARALMNQCLVLVFRRLCETPDCHLPWLDALEDPHMATAVQAILDHPEKPHSLESLAQVAAMSRSSFVQEFTRRFGGAPMTFLREVRLRRAADLLQSDTHTVSAVARRVGFASRSHFSRAFRQYFGKPPSQFRSTPQRR